MAIFVLVNSILALSSLVYLCASKPEYKYSTELTAATFELEVEEVVNGSSDGRQPYFPFVMFHVSWCDRCKEALPEFEEAAKMVSDAQKAGQLHLQGSPKFFTIECDTNDEVKEMCSRHTGTSFPKLKLFRDKRAITFNRPRVASTIAWWSTHASRHIVVQLTEDSHLKQYRESGYSVFVLNTATNLALEKLWFELALDFVEDYRFALVRPSDKVAKKMPKAPGLAVFGEGLKPLPFDDEFDEEPMRAWIGYNRFPEVSELNWNNGYELATSSFPVVTLVYRQDNATSSLLREFDAKAKEMRTNGGYLFARVNLSNKDSAELVEKKYPLVSWVIKTPPVIFIFQDEIYWEDPTLTKVNDIDVARLSALMQSADARQDGSSLAFVKEKRKMLYRVASGSTTGFVTIMSIFPMLFYCCFSCFRHLCASDEPAAVGKAKTDKKRQ